MLCGHLTLPWLTQAEVARSSDEDLAFMPLISKKVHNSAGFSANLLHKIQGNCHLRTKNNGGDSVRALFQSQSLNSSQELGDAIFLQDPASEQAQQDPTEPCRSGCRSRLLARGLKRKDFSLRGCSPGWSRALCGGRSAPLRLTAAFHRGCGSPRCRAGDAASSCALRAPPEPRWRARVG